MTTKRITPRATMMRCCVRGLFSNTAEAVDGNKSTVSPEPTR
jgi:hypothetical protein